MDIKSRILNLNKTAYAKCSKYSQYEPNIMYAAFDISKHEMIDQTVKSLCLNYQHSGSLASSTREQSKLENKIYKPVNMYFGNEEQ